MDLFVDREEDDGEGEVLVRLMWLGELFSVCSNHCKTPILSVVIVRTFTINPISFYRVHNMLTNEQY